MQRSHPAVAIRISGPRGLSGHSELALFHRFRSTKSTLSTESTTLPGRPSVHRVLMFALLVRCVALWLAVPLSRNEIITCDKVA
jgi:hypothetical protein